MSDAGPVAAAGPGVGEPVDRLGGRRDGVAGSVQPTRYPIEPRVADAAADAAALRARVAQVARGGARAAVLGVNDGLVTNVCLILAVAGADASPSGVRLAGFASLIAGAFSMAAGEWVSVRSQVELVQGLFDELRRLSTRNPKLVLDELTDHLVDTGFGRETAMIASTELPLDEPRFLRFTARTIFGVDPDSGRLAAHGGVDVLRPVRRGGAGAPAAVVLRPRPHGDDPVDRLDRRGQPGGGRHRGPLERTVGAPGCRAPAGDRGRGGHRHLGDRPRLRDGRVVSGPTRYRPTA